MFEVCAAPSPQDLAITSPDGGIHSYLDTLARHHNYWQSQIDKAFQNIDLGRHAVSQQLHRNLLQATTIFYANEQGKIVESAFVIEGARRMALGNLALSVLFRRLWPEGEPLMDMRGTGTTDYLLDAQTDQENLPIDHRIHLLPERSERLFPPSNKDTLDAWYRRGPLYVRRVRPAFPSKGAELDMELHDIAIDFKKMETLFPYMATFSL